MVNSRPSEILRLLIIEVQLYFDCELGHVMTITPSIADGRIAPLTYARSWLLFALLLN